MNDVQRLKKSGNWMVRFSRNGIGYAEYMHAPIGQWAECPGWTNSAKCDGGGFFGQTMQYCGYRHDALDIEIAEHGGGIKVIRGNKVAVRRMCILARGQDAMDMLAELCGGEWRGSMNIKNGIRCALTSIGGRAYIREGASVPNLKTVNGEPYHA